MVFGWGKKKSPEIEKEIYSPIEKSIGISDVEKILEEIDSGKIKKLLGQAKYFRKNFESKRNEIIKIIKELEKDDLKVEDMDKHLQILVVRGKKLVISTIKKETTSKLPNVNSFDDAFLLATNLKHELKHVGDVLGRQSRVIHIFAKKYATKLKDNLATLNSERDELQKYIDEYSKLKDTISEIHEKMNEYEESKQKLEEKTIRITDIKKKIEELENKVKLTEQKIQELKKKKEYSEFIEIKEKLTSLSGTEAQIKNEINNRFTKISRPLGKYVYISSMDKEQKNLMETLSENPFSVLVPSNKDDIVAILYAVKKGVESGSVSVKDVSKSVAQIDETIGMLDELIKKRERFDQRKKDLESKLEIFNINELKSEESNLHKNQENKKDSEVKIQNLEKQISDLTAFLPDCLQELERKLRSISKTKYRITVT